MKNSSKKKIFLRCCLGLSDSSTITTTM